jgi:hypothetical protein
MREPDEEPPDGQGGDGPPAPGRGQPPGPGRPPGGGEPPGRGQPPAAPPNPAAYDTERNQVARQKGLPVGYIPGGDDPDGARATAEDRRYLRLLLAMVIAIVLAGFVLGLIAALAGLTDLVGNPG